MRTVVTSATFLLLLVTVIWSGTFVLVKDAVQVVSPFALNSLRFGIALAVSLALFGAKLRSLSRQELLRGSWIGVLYAAGFFLQTFGLQYTTVSRSSFITGSVVVMVPFAYWLIERRRITTAQKLGVTAAAAGLWLFTNPSGGALNIGDTLTFGGAALWAFYMCYLDMFTREPTADGAFGLTVRLVVLQFAVATVIGVVGMIATGTVAIPLSMPVVVTVLYTSLLATVVATFVQTHYQSHLTPVKAALIFVLEPVFASLLAVVVIDEQLGIREVVGGVLIVFGVVAGETGDALVAGWRKALYGRS